MPPIWESKNVLHSSFAKSIGYNCIIVESTNSSICIWNAILTKVPPRKGAISLPDLNSVKSTKLASGGLISIILPSIVESEVAAEPIIWFIASEIALKCNSPNSPSVLLPSPPIIKSVMTFTSCSFKIKILEPSRPTVYLIWINTHGLSYSVNTFSHLANDTTGVVMFTLRLTREYNVVAEEPILILATSPIASLSMSLTRLSSIPDESPACAASVDEASLLSESPPFNSAFISSCDNIPPSMLLFFPLSKYRRYSDSILIFIGAR